MWKCSYQPLTRLFMFTHVKEYGITANFDTVLCQTDKFTYNFMNNTMLLLCWMVSQFISEHFPICLLGSGLLVSEVPKCCSDEKVLGGSVSCESL